jgi:hypothetical protein
MEMNNETRDIVNRMFAEDEVWTVDNAIAIDMQHVADALKWRRMFV